jgi:hypothetical protein
MRGRQSWETVGAVGIEPGPSPVNQPSTMRLMLFFDGPRRRASHSAGVSLSRRREGLRAQRRYSQRPPAQWPRPVKAIPALLSNIV